MSDLRTVLAEIVKANDIRGVVPDQLSPDVARRLGAGFARYLTDSGAEPPAVVVARDMRDSSPAVAAAFVEGVTGAGLDVIDVGLGSTDLLYYASGALDLPGAMVTASHNPARYNGLKLSRAGAAPIGLDTGLAEIRAYAEQPAAPAAEPGTVSRRDLLGDYAAYLRSLVDLSGIRPLTVVVDAANGMGGHTVPAVFGADAAALPVTVVPLYFELDGSFPNHPADPLNPANLVDLQRAVVEAGADLGFAFDGDADRCFVIDERGEPVSPSAVTALVAGRELARSPGESVVYNLICSKSVPEIVGERGGTPVRAKVGHTFMKSEMARTGAIFGGEHSAHYYFRDFWKADTGMLAALHVLAALGETETALSKLMDAYDRYVGSGEINSTVADVPARIAAVEAEFAARAGATSDRMDGLTVELADGRWFNLRPSNTEPLLRLNVEALDATSMAALRDEVLAIVRT